ncbi:MAG: G-D-S-L family lipolytic protein [Bacteroidia bacterium]|nr:G-D-S-L family lipolytic protein [Bacteroidia bacterium]NNF30460.1 G-D-S-L family lipolytic protein [Flavobacteriaceae bacterium]MBT8275201.1 G-D-S-L family lipolytic protein [Bacteroidia bacterium]NNJ80664.1 G-D-S-L family lipolytic protein [Flavobacteriaceae bacterium]NNK53912.1 G-D-S-L family lipolytic protein [Flavobacteriaceae bacterium]
MKSLYKNRLLLASALGLFLFASCENDDIPVVEEEEVIPLVAGSANVANYVSIGNSLTAGLTDGALFILGQENSFPNLLAQKFAMIGGGDFTQPLMNDNIGGLLLGGVQIQNPRLYFDGAGPALVNQTPTTEVSNIQAGPYNNMGVPGAKSFHLLANGYGSIGGVQTGQANPYFVRMASNPNASMLEDAVAQNPTFFSLWIGSNDVLSFATSGGAGVNQTGNPDPTTYGSTDITDPAAFDGIYNAILGSLAANGSQGIVANIPYVFTIPYFTTVPYNPVPADANTAALVNAGYAPYNVGLQQALAAGLITAEEATARTINFVEGQNAVVIEDEYLTDLSALGLPNYRQTTEADLPTLLSASFIGTLVNNDPTLINGVTVPLADQWVLTVDEVEEVTVATDAYNASIAAAASANGVILIDANAFLQQIFDTGIMFDEFNLNGSLVFGGTFSLDGVHPTARGNAFVANQILLAMDEFLGTNFEEAGELFKAADFTTIYPEVLP